MADFTIQNLPQDVHQALMELAAKNGRSTDAEACDILSKAVLPTTRLRLGDSLAELGLELGLTNGELKL